MIRYPFRCPVREYTEEAKRRWQFVLILLVVRRLMPRQVQVRQHGDDVHGNCLRVTVRWLSGFPQPGGLVQGRRVQHRGWIPGLSESPDPGVQGCEQVIHDVPSVDPDKCRVCRLRLRQ